MQSAGVTSTGNAANAAEEGQATLTALLAVEEVVLSAELAELLRWRNVMWGLIPALSRALVLPYLTVKETLRLDVAVTETGDEKNPGDRDHLLKAYSGLRSGGFDEWVFSDANNFEGVRWARKRGVDLRELKLEYKGDRDGDKVLGQLVVDKDEDMATYYALRSEARDTDIFLAGDDDFDENEDDDAERSYDSTTLIEALRVGYLAVANCLLERGADVNKANDLGETPLIWASLNGYLEVAKVLLAAKAKVDKADNWGCTPLIWASSRRHMEVVKTLLAAEAEVDKANLLGQTPLYRASQIGHMEVVKTLLAAEAEVNKADNEGKTPLFWALFLNYTEIVALLRAAGATE
jgi:ankyrin repeat protein